MKLLKLSLITLFAYMSLLHAKDTTSTDTTTTPLFPPKKPSRPAWEYWVSTPLWIVASPWIILNKGVERSIGYVDDHKIIPAVKRVLISKDESRVIMPTHSSPIGSGIRYLKKDLLTPGSELNFIATYGLGQRHSLSADWQELRIAASPWYLGMTTGYHFKTDEAWYGLGSDTDDKTEADYALRQFYGEISLKRTFGQYISFDFVGGATYSSVEQPPNNNEEYITRIFPKKSLPGIFTDLISARTAIRLEFNNTNRKGNPSRGWEISLTTGGSPQLNDTEFGYYKTSLDIHKYIHLFYDRTLVFRFENQIIRSFSDRAIPFYSLSELGTKETIRGFDRGRFHDRDRLIGTVEYRYPIWTPRHRAIDAVLFADAGQVMRDVFSDATKADIHYGIGGGFRFYSEEDLVARIELSRSKEIWRFYFVLN